MTDVVFLAVFSVTFRFGDVCPQVFGDSRGTEAQRKKQIETLGQRRHIAGTVRSEPITDYQQHSTNDFRMISVLLLLLLLMCLVGWRRQQIGLNGPMSSSAQCMLGVAGTHCMVFAIALLHVEQTPIVDWMDEWTAAVVSDLRESPQPVQRPTWLSHSVRKKCYTNFVSFQLIAKSLLLVCFLNSFATQCMF